MKKIKIYFDPPKEIHLNQYARKFQGYLMENIEVDYAEYLHHQEMNTYSMRVYLECGELVWEIALLDPVAIDKMEGHLMSFNLIELRDKIDLLKVKRRMISELTQKDLADDFYRKSPQKYHALQFLTPTSFKQSGQYVNFPDVKLILQSLIMKQNFLEVGDLEVHEELLDELLKAVTISNYQLKSTYYEVHRYRIPSFVGHMTLKVKGSEALKNYVRNLLLIGEYTGIGIKCSMGMGAMVYHQADRRKDR